MTSSEIEADMILKDIYSGKEKRKKIVVHAFTNMYQLLNLALISPQPYLSIVIFAARMNMTQGWT